MELASISLLLIAASTDLIDFCRVAVDVFDVVEVIVGLRRTPMGRHAGMPDSTPTCPLV